jgi:hypothetical protein
MTATTTTTVLRKRAATHQRQRGDAGNQGRHSGLRSILHNPPNN